MDKPTTNKPTGVNNRWRSLDRALAVISDLANTEAQQEILRLKAQLGKIEADRDKWKAKSEYYRTKLLERK